MTLLTYITNYLLPSWVRQWTCNFSVWADLITNNYEVYANPWSESPERECYEWFWSFINMDDTLSKKSIDEFYQRLDDNGLTDTLTELKTSLND